MTPDVTVPHAGDYHIAYEYFFESLGYRYFPAPKSSKESLDIGVKRSPSQACLPFKCTIGNLLQAFEQGADMIGMIGGRTGMCRLVYYSELYKKILTDHGYNPKIFPIKLTGEMWNAHKEYFPKARLSDFAYTFYGFWHKMRLLEILREQCLLNRPYEKARGACSRLYQQLLPVIRSAKTLSEMKKTRMQILNAFDDLPKDLNRKTIRIGMIGEFFLLIDPFATLNMETTLGEMGVVLEISESFSSFFIGSIKQVRFLDHFLPTKRHRVNQLAKPFINRPIGGHARQTIGHALLYAQQGFDGCILLYPFTCMPEITANAVMPQVSQRCNLPVLTLCFDEQTGTEGLKTRLEAFVDMIFRKKAVLR